MLQVVVLLPGLLIPIRAGIYRLFGYCCLRVYVSKGKMKSWDIVCCYYFAIGIRHCPNVLT